MLTPELEHPAAEIQEEGLGGCGCVNTLGGGGDPTTYNNTNFCVFCFACYLPPAPSATSTDVSACSQWKAGVLQEAEVRVWLEIATPKPHHTTHSKRSHSRTPPRQHTFVHLSIDVPLMNLHMCLYVYEYV